MEDLYVKEVEGKGRGVFSSQNIKAGQCIEIAPVIVFPHTQELRRTLTQQTVRQEGRNTIKTITNTIEIVKPLPEPIADVIFNWSDLVDDGEHNFCVVLGLGSIFNSANPSNLRFEGNKENKTVSFYAVVDIPAHTELTINYSGIKGSHISDNNYWFDNKTFIE